MRVGDRVGVAATGERARIAERPVDNIAAVAVAAAVAAEVGDAVAVARMPAKSTGTWKAPEMLSKQKSGASFRYLTLARQTRRRQY